MAATLYLSAEDDIARGAINLASDTFGVQLLTSAYVPNKLTHSRRSDLTSEVTGTGYTAGGIIVPVTVVKDPANGRVDIVFSAIQIPAGTFTARYAAISKRRGGAASADELVGLADFGADKTVNNEPFFLSSITLRRSV